MCRQRLSCVLLAFGVAAAITAGVLATSGTASAALQYPLLQQCANPPGGTRVAVDGHTGHILVVVGATIQVLSSTCQLLETWTGANTPAGSFEERNGFLQIAAYDNAPGGRIYVGDVGHKVIDVFNSAGQYQCQITGQAGKASSSASECDQETPATPGGIGAATAFAVNQSNGELYAAEAGEHTGETAVVNRYSAAGGFEEQNTGASTVDGAFATEIASMAVDGKADQLLVETRGFVGLSVLHAIYIFEVSSGAYLGELSGAGTPAKSFGERFLRVAADNESGQMFVEDSEHRVVDELTETGGYVDQLTGVPGKNLFTALEAIAIGQADHRLYVHDRETLDIFGDERVLVPDVAAGAPEELHAFSARLAGIVNPDGVVVKRCQFEYIGNTQFEAHKAVNGFEGATRVPCEESPASIGSGNSPVAVHANVSGLEAATVYHVRVNAGNGNEAENEFSYGAYSADAPFETLKIPVINLAETTSVSATDASVRLVVNPKGSLSLCRIEYHAVKESYGAHSVGCQPEDLGEGNSDITATATLSGLAAGETYYWRAAIENPATAPAPVLSSEQTLVYLKGQEVLQQCGNEELRSENNSLALPDCRAYELITPASKNGATIGHGIIILPGITAANGSRVIAASIQGFGGTQSDSASRQNEGALYSFTRSPQGWITTPLSPPATILASSTYWDVDPETGAALFSGPTAPDGQDNFYLRAPDGTLTNVGPITPPEDGAEGPAMDEGPLSTPDLSHFLFRVKGTLDLQWPFDGTRAGQAHAVYEYADAGSSEPFLVGVTGGQNSTELIGVCGGEPDAISEDGATVINTVLACSSGSGTNRNVKVSASELYARIDGETSAARTVQLSARSAGHCSGSCQHSAPADALFMGANQDASKVFFTSTQQLADSATEASNNLYLYDLDGQEAEQPIVVSAGDTSGGGPRVQGVMAVSPDGSHVYFVAKGVLAENTGAAVDPKTGQPAKAVSGEDNLYVYQRDSQYPAGQTTFIATLPEADEVNWITHDKTNITPEGRYLLFPSHAGLTADDTRAEGPVQIYRYDAAESQLVRVTIGERGFNNDGNSGRGDASILQSVGIRPNPCITDDGAYVFFESPVALAPGALNDVQIATDVLEDTPVYAQNVYEYHEGQVYLITDGTDTATVGPNSAVKLLGASDTGQDIFFTTASSLVPADTNTQQDIYDARIEGGFPSPTQPHTCTNDECRAAASNPPQQTTPTSSVYTGPENLAAPPAKVTTKASHNAKKHANCTKAKHGKCGKQKKRRRSGSKKAHAGARRHKRATKRRGARR